MRLTYEVSNDRKYIEPESLARKISIERIFDP